MDELIVRCYQILGAKVGAKKKEVEQAYNNEVKTWQPERFADDAELYQKAYEKIKEINWAYETLNKYFTEIDKQVELDQDTKKFDAGTDKYITKEKTSIITDSMKFAGFWIRVAAFMIDIAVLTIPTLMISFFIRFTVADELAYGIESFISNTLVCWIYEAAFISSTRQGTIGKMLLGLKVVDYAGNRITFGRATGRYFSKWLSGLILCIGYMMVGWTKKKQGLHDVIADTLVIRS
jgi:uncharacterized RDD family membrane protein YckC